MYSYPLAAKTVFAILAQLTVSPLGKTTRGDPGMLQMMSSPHSKQQAALATQTTSTGKENVARHTVPDCRGRTTDIKSTRMEGEKREHFVKLILGNKIILCQQSFSRVKHNDCILTTFLPATGICFYVSRSTFQPTVLWSICFPHR